jgi:hypothetical protein
LDINVVQEELINNDLTVIVGTIFDDLVNPRKAFVVNYVIAITISDNSHVWRYMLAVVALLAMALFIGMLRTDESPRWLVSRGRISEAMNVLKKYPLMLFHW